MWNMNETYHGDQTVITLLVSTKLPPHTTTKTLRLDVLTLLTRNLRGIIADE
jgi:hypothetical protein